MNNYAIAGFLFALAAIIWISAPAPDNEQWARDSRAAKERGEP